MKILSVTSPKSPHPHTVLVPVLSLWRLFVVSQQRFCEDKAELWVTVTEAPKPALCLGSMLHIGDFFSPSYL